MDPEAGSVGRVDTLEDTDDSEVAEIEVTRARIEQTRSEMGETIDAIKEKLSPQHLAEQAKETIREATIGRAQEAASHVVDAAKEAVGGAVDTARETMSNVSETARDAGSNLMETIRQNPAAVGLIGIGLSWLCMSSWRDRSAHRQYDDRDLSRNESRPQYGGTYGYESMPASSRQTTGTSAVGETLREAREKVGDVAGQVQEKAGEVVHRTQEKAGEVVHRAQEQVSRVGTQAAFQAQRAEYAFRQMLYENPIAAGAVALGLGAAIGLIIPETPQENRMMGEARDALVERAQQTAQDVSQKVQSVAQEAISSATETAREEARHQGLATTN